MSAFAVRVEQLGKRYRLGGARARADSLREAATHWLHAPFRAVSRAFGRGNGQRADGARELWALRDVSLDIARGEAVGIIGRNGSGKSTLLKILSRITLPTEGMAEIHGRAGSLLEVGTGFHPELTGGENIYLNGAILGMKRREIKARFDEIVEFAELSRFVDTPVKLYSSGMYVRLAFAVAAHLEPEVLMVDEVLAVGDASFQQKCLGRMGAVTREGRTVLFVSHDMTAVQNLTKRAVLLEGGGVLQVGPSAAVIESYLARCHAELDRGDGTVASWPDREGRGQARVVGLEVLDGEGRPVQVAALDAPLRIRLTCEFQEECEASFGVLVHSLMHEPLVDLRSSHGALSPRRYRGRVVVETEIPALPLYPGQYLLSPWIADRMEREDIDFVHYCTRLTVVAPPAERERRAFDPVWGKVVVDSRWRTD